MKLFNAALAAVVIMSTPAAVLAATAPAGTTAHTTAATQANAGMVARAAVISLGCTAGSGDVARPLYVKNTSAAAIANGKVITWSASGAHGQQTLSSALAVGATVTVNGPAGSGGTCTATVPK